MAVVNGEDIRREALAAACVDRFGEETLEGMVNKRLIEHHCRNRNITVTDEEIDAEIDRMAARFKIGREAVAGDARERTGHQRTTIQARHPLADARAAEAGGRPTARSPTSKIQEAYDAQFGEAVKARLIVGQIAGRGGQIAAAVGCQSGRFRSAGDAAFGRTSTARASAG